jgi:hypothetical protein
MAVTGLRAQRWRPCPAPREDWWPHVLQWVPHLLGISYSCVRCCSDWPRLPFHTWPATSSDPSRTAPTSKALDFWFPDLLLFSFQVCESHGKLIVQVLGSGRLSSTSLIIPLLGVWEIRVLFLHAVMEKVRVWEVTVLLPPPATLRGLWP